MNRYLGRKARGAQRRVVAAMMALVGASLTGFVVNEDLNNFSQAGWSDLPFLLVVRGLFFMGLGGAIMGWLFAGLFGRRGVMGWALAGAGGALATLLSGLAGTALWRLPDLLVGGPQAGDLVSIVAGLLVPVFAMAGNPILAGVWVVVIAVTHVLAIRACG